MAVVLCIAGAASAIELTWNQTCMQKTSRAVTLYVNIEGDSLTAANTLPAGTYIRTTGQTMEGKTGISYSANNRDPLYGYIDGSAIVSAAQTITLPSGKKVQVSEALVRSRQALNLWLEMEYGETLGNSATYTDGNGVEHEIGNESAAGAENQAAGDAAYYNAIYKAYSENGGSTPTVYRDDDGNETDVEVVYMGLARSMVIMEGEKQLVETWRLSWETEAPEDKVLAVVHSPQNSADVKFHAGKSTKSMNLNKVLTNRVLRVISTGKNWTLVDIDDPEMPRGYISTSYLEFYPNIPMPYRPAKLSVLGRTKGSDPVWIRAEDSADARRITQFDLGEPLSVYAQNEKWSEVDVGGYHAFILSEFVTMDDTDTTTAEAP